MPVYFKKEDVENKIKVSILSKNNIGLVPTMGSLHEGHLSLIENAVNNNDNVWVSIFVNPTQFSSSENLNKYPKDLEKDVVLIKTISENINIFCPSETEIYGGIPKLKKYDFDNIDIE